MFSKQIINLTINTSYTYYFYLDHISSAIGSANGTISALTGSTFSVGGCKISKNGGAPANTTNLPSEIGNGWYSIVLTASEMNTQDVLLYIANAGANGWDAVWLCTTSVGSGGGGGSLTADQVWQEGTAAMTGTGSWSGSIGAYIKSELSTIAAGIGSAAPTLSQIQTVVEQALLIFGRK